MRRDKYGTNQVWILEGVDGGGKTRLAEWLRDTKGWTVRHEGPPPEGVNLLHYYGGKLLSALRANAPVVFDRLHIGETIYGPVARGEDRLTPMGLRLIERIANAYGVPTLLCLPPYEVCEQNWERDVMEDNDYLRDWQRFHEVYWRYWGLLSYYPKFDYTYSKTAGYEAALEYLLEMPRNQLPFGTIGDPKAEVLIVGEQVNHRELDLPFFALGNSSGFLNSSLWAAGFKESQLAFTNALEIRGEERNLLSVLGALPRLKGLIALGELSTKVCRRQLPASTVHPAPHPSFWKRFNYHRKEEYVDKLRRIKDDLKLAVPRCLAATACRDPR